MADKPLTQEQVERIRAKGFGWKYGSTGHPDCRCGRRLSSQRERELGRCAQCEVAAWPEEQRTAIYGLISTALRAEKGEASSAAVQAAYDRAIAALPEKNDDAAE